MASPSLASTLTSSSLSPKLLSTPTSSSSSSSPSFISITRGLRCLLNRKIEHQRRNAHQGFSPKALTLDFSGSFFEGGDGEDERTSGFGISEEEDEREEPECPPGLRQYETMAVLRPDMNEEERLNCTQKYEELLVAGGAMYVEVYNRGVIPLSYSIKRKNRAGETNTYMDGIYLLFTYFTKPESIPVLESRLNTDDNIIRSSSFKIRKRKY